MHCPLSALYDGVMRPIVISFLFLIVLLPGVAGGSQCESISDSDDRHMCRAVSTGKTLYCESIRDSDKRHYCRGVVGGRPIFCESIRDEGTRKTCRRESNR